MEEPNLILTPTDRAVLESYKQMMDGLSAYMGSGYEFVLHSLENYERSVVKIINGFHTGRSVGAPITDLALSMLERIRSSNEQSGHISYFAKNKNGEPLKSTTITVLGENGRIIGLLCINLYLNTPINEMIKDFVSFEPQQTSQKPEGVAENFVESIDDLIENSVKEVRAMVLGDTSIPSNCKNKVIVRRLKEMGIFTIKDAVGKVAAALNISKNTVYMHIRNHHEE